MFQIVDGNGTDVPKDKKGLLLYKGGTVCAKRFDHKAAHSICKEMGFSGARSWEGRYNSDIRYRWFIKLYEVQCIDDHCWSSCSYSEESGDGDCHSWRPNVELVYLTCYEDDYPGLNHQSS